MMTKVGIISTDESQLFEFGLSVPARSIKNNEKNHIFHENDSKSEKSTKNEDFMELKYEFAESFQMTQNSVFWVLTNNNIHEGKDKILV